MELEQAIIVYAIITSITIIYLILRTRYIQKAFEKYIKYSKSIILSERKRTLIAEKEIIEDIIKIAKDTYKIQDDLRKVEKDSLKRDIQLIKRILRNEEQDDLK